MLSEVGHLLLGSALLTTLYAAFAAAHAIRQHDSRWQESALLATYTNAAILGAALLLLWGAFLSDHFALRYVTQYSSNTLPLYLKISALWAGQEGSLLLWCALQAALAAIALRYPQQNARGLLPWATVFLNVITGFFVLVTLFQSNPFTTLAVPPSNGQGLNPVLRHPGMIFHPPALYVGYVGLSVPFAFALAALVTKKVTRWTAALRPWILVAWLGLGTGLLLGMRWAYDVLGWGGYWGWDPVENAGLLPWFTTTALLHGAVMQDEKRGFHIWNLLLTILSFSLVLFGTFATRSGVIQSVHAYAQSNLGGYYLGAIAVTLVASAALFIARRRYLRTLIPQGDDAPALFSRAGLFYLTLLLLLTLTASVFVGTLLPTLSELWGSRRLEAGPAWFDQVSGPQFAALLLLMGVCPVLGRSAASLRRQPARVWLYALGSATALGASSLAGFTHPLALLGCACVGLALTTTLAEYGHAIKQQQQRGSAPLNALWHLLRQRRRTYGGYLVHIGVLLMALGIIGTRFYNSEHTLTLTTGTPATVGNYTLRYAGLRDTSHADYTHTQADVAIYRQGNYLATLSPGLERYTTSRESITAPALKPMLREDLYLILSGWTANGDSATFKVIINPLINYLWLGGLIFLAGGASALWPQSTNKVVNRIALGSGALLLIVAAWAMWGAPNGISPEHTASRPLNGQTAPRFQLPLLDGETLAFPPAQKDVVVINFWASSCAPCQDELPDLESVWQTYQERGVSFIGVAYQENEPALRAARDTYGLTYPLGLDEGERIANSYGITGVPETFVIDHEGRVAYVHIGPLSAETLSAELDALLVP